jgi:hypothetical protein
LRQLKFVGISSAEPDASQHFFQYFLDREHHKRGVPIDAISYHFYALGHADETEEAQAQSFFSQADHFVQTVDKIETIRMRLSPQTQTQINETGCISANDLSKQTDSMNGKDIPPSYWNLCGAMFAYLYGHLVTKGIDLLGASQLLGYPTQFPSVSLLNWNSGLPNPRYRMLQLLMEHFHAGDKVITVQDGESPIYCEGFISADGHKTLLLVNKSAKDIVVNLTGVIGAKEEHVDITTGSTIETNKLDSDEITVRGFAEMTIGIPVSRAH